MTTLHSIYTVLLNLFFLLEEYYGSEEEDMWNTPHSISIALVVFTALISCCVGGLSAYHGKLACSGITTNEEIRGKYNDMNPFDEGCSGNCKAFWFGGTSRVYIDGTYDVKAMS
jgi:energy-converting hydrogenase Eha subunit G